MYLGIDIGGTKTLVARLDENGVIRDERRFPTPHDYADFLSTLTTELAVLDGGPYRAAGVGAPGRLDLEQGVGIAFGNLPWRDVPLKADIHRLVDCPVVMENDARLAGLSEAMLAKDKETVLYVTISTGINIGVSYKQTIDPVLQSAEAGQMLLEHDGVLARWESFASGKAIVARYGKRASDLNDPEAWKHIAHDIAAGLFELIALIEPDLIVLGGGVGTYYDKFSAFLEAELHSHQNPLLTIPPIKAAERPEKAVIYGCYDLASATYGSATPIA